MNCNQWACVPRIWNGDKARVKTGAGMGTIVFADPIYNCTQHSSEEGSREKLLQRKIETASRAAAKKAAYATMSKRTRMFRVLALFAPSANLLCKRAVICVCCFVGVFPRIGIDLLLVDYCLGGFVFAA